jgi:pimeloyl-ACP methyl ester carboxylesterase
LAVDLRGHGDSDWAPDGDYTPPTIAADVRAVLEWFGGRPAIVGASLGGQAALLALGEAEQSLASALILVDVTPRVDLEGARRVLSFMRSRPDGFESLEEAADAVAAYLPHRPRPTDNAGLANNLRRAGGRYRWHWDPLLVEQNERSMMPTERLLKAARRVRVPTLLVRGGLSDVVTPDTAGEFVHIVPEAELITVTEAGHMVAGDQNDVFTAAVVEFLDRALGQSPASR